MTRFVFDQFSKDFFESLLGGYGVVETGKRVSSEVREIDVWFSTAQGELPPELGLLGEMASMAGVSLFEPYRNPVTVNEIADCLQKQNTVRGQMYREALRQKSRFDLGDWPKLWILTPTASKDVLGTFGAENRLEGTEGVYYLAEGLKTAIVVLHQLPVIPETLWLRILGRGKIQKQAIDELQALPASNPIRSITLELLYNLQQNLELSTEQDQEDQELIMRLKPLYQQDRQRAIEEGKQQGESKLILRQLNRRLGELSSEIAVQINQLSIEQLEELGEALFDFQSESDLRNWLLQHN
ncbi:DUF4351 domain-containing protein [Crocosphaera sp.]|uniref:DUF4351 domain-containing protein n=1 Tax=Crocosphaera sp. TaxID=2729996 RepID=UPI002580CFC5|nr:DUF4351 domain-containing protein [Crocosphaera sp.]NQZ61956.1 DUF4351 domain-containing protein [Crocosphaera sp.]